MKIKLRYKTRDELPKGMEELYEEVDGEFVLTGVEGMKSQDDVTRVQQSLVNERKAHKDTKVKLEAISAALPEGMTAEQVVEKLDGIAELEARVQAAEKKGGTDNEAIDRIVETRVKRALAPVERERDQLRKQVGDLSAERDGLASEKKQGKIDGAIQKIAADMKVNPSAIDDVLLRARTMFELDEAGRVVTKEADGVTPGLDPKAWLTDMQSKASHWWPLSEGAGAKGAGLLGGKQLEGNPWSAKSWNMTLQGQYLKEHGAEKAGQLAKQAGAVLGGPMPAAK